MLVGRPRIRIQNPVIHFGATASLKQSDRPLDTAEDEYLPPQIPAPLNLLESFQDDPDLGHVTPKLSAMRVSRVMPTTGLTKEQRRPLRNSAPQTIRAVPACSARVRYSKVNGHSSKPSVIASLDFEVTPMAQCSVRLEDINLQMAAGSCEDLMGRGGPKLPLTCQPKDDLTFLYRLTTNEALEALGQSSYTRTLEIRITVTALVSDDCHPRIVMRWRANIDLSATLNPSFGGPSQGLQRNRRPTVLTPVAAASEHASAPSAGAPGPEGARSGDDAGLTVSVTGPEHVYQGCTFTRRVFIVNRSNRVRQLALLVIPVRGEAEASKDSLSRRNPLQRSGGTTRSTAEAVMDDIDIYALQKQLEINAAAVVSLSTDVRVG